MEDLLTLMFCSFSLWITSLIVGILTGGIRFIWIIRAGLWASLLYLGTPFRVKMITLTPHALINLCYFCFPFVCYLFTIASRELALATKWSNEKKNIAGIFKIDYFPKYLAINVLSRQRTSNCPISQMTCWHIWICCHLNKEHFHVWEAERGEFGVFL